MTTKKYSASIMSYSFWYLETKIIAEYMLNGYSKKEILELALEENIFQTNSERRAREITNHLYRRLNGFSEELLQYLVNAESSSGKLLVLISVLKEDKLFFEFMYEVFREHIILGNNTLKISDFDDFLMNKSNQSEVIGKWIETTQVKVKVAYRTFLTEAGLLKKNKTEFDIIVPLVDFTLKDLLINNELIPYLKAISGEN